ncbi:MAG TPA: signal peptidase I, partial [Planctomycetota bacterium]|nr:signal peptidase I [Planctomycetota bacterium]
LAGMAIGILLVLRNGVTLLAVPAVGYFVVYAFLSHERFRASGAAKASKLPEPLPPEHPLAWLKENVEAIAVAFIMALVIRCFCVEVFKIPSSSMEPTLMGDSPADNRGGDRIMVTKLTYAVQDVGRFEPVVFKFPLNPMKNYIKRVVGLPSERLMLHRGNVYTIPDGSPDETYRIRRKPLRIQRSLWIRSWNRNDRPLLQSREAFQECFTADSSSQASIREGALQGGGPGSSRWIGRDIDDGHLGDGRFKTDVSDIVFEADLELQEGSGRFWIRIEHDFGPFELSLDPSGGSTLLQAGTSHPLKTPAFPVGKAVRVEFMVFDGQAFVLLDGREQCSFVFHEVLDESTSRSARNGLLFGAEGIRFRLTKLWVGQDIHYKPKQEDLLHSLSRERPLRIPAGCYFMLGDNVNNSHDGRVWKRHVVELKDGRRIEFESLEKGRPEMVEAWSRRTGRPAPYLYVAADLHGHEQVIEWDQIAEGGEKRPEPFPFVEARFIIGRAFAVCWPLSRSLRLIR